MGNCYLDLSNKTICCDSKEAIGTEIRIWEYGDYDIVKITKAIKEEKRNYGWFCKYNVEILRENPNRPEQYRRK